jgi:hypothetical protein
MPKQPITAQPDSVQPSAPVNVSNAPAPAMSQEAYSLGVQAAMQARRDGLRKHGAKNGAVYLPPASTIRNEQ